MLEKINQTRLAEASVELPLAQMRQTESMRHKQAISKT